MNRNSERGMALVITLLMLAVVTVMAVVFLGISRREKASVAVTADQTDARLMTEAGLSRARAEIAVRMLITTNPFSYEMIVSTNYINPQGFRSGVSSPTNVSYVYSDGRPLSAQTQNDWLQNLANLQYDPRPPVFIPTNSAGNVDFRYYLDFNRNRRFDTNGWSPAMGRTPGQYVDTNGVETSSLQNAQFENFVGDPEWTGVLERPDRPHSESNRFVGRYAYMVLPAGKSLDLNFIHNNAKGVDPNLRANNFSRSQGVGSWEINLAAFLRDLNTNAWQTYLYRTAAFVPSVGDSFDDARAFLSHRYFDQTARRYELASVANLFGPANANILRLAGVDNYSDGLTPPDIATRPWSGSPNPEGYYDVQELFEANRTSPQFLARLAARTFNSVSSYDRYSVYRLLSQMGTDSKPSESNKLYQADFQLRSTKKLHLNYRNDLPNGETNFVSWTALEFFTQAADRLLRASLATNINPRLPVALSTHFMLGEVPVRNTCCLTNIQIYYTGPTVGLPYYVTNNEYSSTVHRALQVAANLYDATTTRPFGTNNNYPSVFRPVFGKTPTNIFIAGYVEVTNTFDLTRNRWRDLNLPVDRLNLGRDDNVFGVPWVVGAKKGYPNFNEFTLQTMAQVSRKLELRKSSINSLPNQTNQMYVLGVSNLFGIEAWNSYTQDFRRSFALLVTNQVGMSLDNVVDLRTNVFPSPTGVSLLNWRVITTNLWAGWPNPGSFVVPINESITFLTNSVYLNESGLFTTNNSFEKSTRVPRWVLHVTNRLQYILIDNDAKPVPRIVDFVNLDRLITHLDITRQLMGDTNAGGGGIFGDRQRTGSLADNDVWNTNRVVRNNINAPSFGVTNQIGISAGIPFVGDGVWRSASGDPVAGRDKEKSIQAFSDFMRGQSTNLVMQTPFSPSRTIYQKRSWQVNDPLVHYTVDDLADPASADPNNFNTRAISLASLNLAADSGMGRLNERYDPWGGNPQKTASATSYKLTIKDPAVSRSDDWEFPTNKFANLGWLGRVHRGTAWQTIYLKSEMEPLDRWLAWSGSFGTHPTNDWKFIDLFTVAPNANASRGLLSVNQTNLAAWSAVLGGVHVLSNSVANPATVGIKFDDVFIPPNSTQLVSIVRGINRARALQPNRVFRTIGEVLSTPELTLGSPFLNFSTARRIERGLNDAAVERIPQQILSLLKTDEPRIVVYSFGQSLKPAERSLVTSGNFYNICTNYQVTGELVTKTVLRIEDAPQRPRTVVESYNILPSE